MNFIIALICFVVSIVLIQWLIPRITIYRPGMTRNLLMVVTRNYLIYSIPLVVLYFLFRANVLFTLIVLAIYFLTHVVVRYYSGPGYTARVAAKLFIKCRSSGTHTTTQIYKAMIENRGLPPVTDSELMNWTLAQLVIYALITESRVRIWDFKKEQINQKVVKEIKDELNKFGLQ